MENELIISVVHRKSWPERIPAFGLLLAFISVFFFSWQTVLVKLLRDFHAIEILVFRSFIQLIMYIILSLFVKNNIFGQIYEQRFYIMLRALFGTITTTSIFMAYKLIPISEASTILSSSPVFVAIIGYFVLKEKLTIVQIITGIITLIGVVIIAKPEFIFGSEAEEVHEHKLLGLLLAFTACISASFVYIILRKLKSTPVEVICIWFSIVIIISGVIILAIIEELVWPTGWLNWLMIFATGFCSFGDQYFFTIAFKYENVGPVSVVRTFNIALVFVWEILVLSKSVEWTSILGSSLVFVCLIIMSLFKWKTESPEQFRKVFNRFYCNENVESKSVETICENIKYNI